MRQALAVLVLLGLVHQAEAAEPLNPSLFSLFAPTVMAQAPAKPEQQPSAQAKDATVAAYRGGRGLITLEGPTGMFINPTSGTAEKGAITAQYCAAMLEQNDYTEVQHTAILSYGVTDWLELGLMGRVSILDTTNDTVSAGGPWGRVRVLKDAGWFPEVSLGGILREGSGRLQKRTIFLAASKGYQFPQHWFIKSVRGHAGFRQIWQDGDFNEDDVSIGYFGGEIELPMNLFIVGEVSTRDPDAFRETPSAIGVQFRHPSGFGFSLAAIQSGGDDRMGVYVGIGINFK